MACEEIRKRDAASAASHFPAGSVEINRELACLVEGRDVQRPEAPSTLSDRSLPIAKPRWVTARHRPLERVLASCGLLTSTELEFLAADDVPNGGVLCALPALLAEEVLRHTRTFYRLQPGFTRWSRSFGLGSAGTGALPLPVPRRAGQTIGLGSATRGQSPAAKSLADPSGKASRIIRSAASLPYRFRRSEANGEIKILDAETIKG